MNIFVDRTGARLLLCLALGVVSALVANIWAGPVMASLIGWTAAALLFSAMTFLVLWGMSGEDTRGHARREDASQTLSEILCLVASLASIGGVIVLLAGAHADGGAAVLSAVVAVAVVVSSWLLVHTVYALRYTGMHYDGNTDAHIDFNEPEGYLPSYSDFYYVAFDMGTTYQVSDTSVSGRTLRREVMGHGMLGYVFGTVILATVINVVVSLVQG